MVKTLLKSVRQYKRVSIETPLFVTMEVILECTIPLIMSKLIDDMTGTSMAPSYWSLRPFPCSSAFSRRERLPQPGADSQRT